MSHAEHAASSRRWLRRLITAAIVLPVGAALAQLEPLIEAPVDRAWEAVGDFKGDAKAYLSEMALWRMGKAFVVDFTVSPCTCPGQEVIACSTPADEVDRRCHGPLKPEPHLTQKTLVFRYTKAFDSWVTAVDAQTVPGILLFVLSCFVLLMCLPRENGSSWIALLGLFFGAPLAVGAVATVLLGLLWVFLAAMWLALAGLVALIVVGVFRLVDHYVVEWLYERILGRFGIAAHQILEPRSTTPRRRQPVLPAVAASWAAYPPPYRRRVIDLHKAGRTVDELSSELNISATTVRMWILQAAVDAGEIRCA